MSQLEREQDRINRERDRIISLINSNQRQLNDVRAEIRTLEDEERRIKDAQAALDMARVNARGDIDALNKLDCEDTNKWRGEQQSRAVNDFSNSVAAADLVTKRLEAASRDLERELDRVSNMLMLRRETETSLVNRIRELEIRLNSL